jgi:hypothetical protein
LPAVYGWLPTLRIADFDVPWLWEHDANARMTQLLSTRIP